MRTLAQKRRMRRQGFLVNGYPDGEGAQQRTAVWERWRRIRHARLLRMQQAETPVTKLKDMEPIALLDCSYSAQDLFNALPRLSDADQATLVDYVEMRLNMWRKDRAQGEP